MTYLSILDCAGNLAFTVSYILVAQKITKDRLIWFITAALPMFSEIIFICNLVSLHTKPSILYSLCKNALTLSIALAISSGLFCKKRSYKKESYIATKIFVILKMVLLIADSLGVLASVAIGYEQGLLIGNSQLAAIICGWGTAMGGGVLARITASILVSMPLIQKLQWLKHELNRNILYYVSGLIIALVFSLLAAVMGKDLTVIVMTAPAIIVGIFTNKEISMRN